jgi:hypothetical protein
LTKNRDKFVAISAIAKQFAPILKDEYKAGLWRRHLPQHLLWQVLSPPTVDRPPTSSENYCAPSWSWGSLTADITPYSGIVAHDKPIMIDILEVIIETLTADPMGQVSGGHIKLRGWLKYFSPPRRDDDEDDDASWTFKTPGKGICFAWLDQLPIPEDRKWYCLPILETVKQEGRRESKTVIGLMLLETGRKDEFRRVGRFDAVKQTSNLFRRPTYPFQAARNPEKKDLRSPSVQGGNGEGTASNSQLLERETTAAEMDTNHNEPSSTGQKRRLIPSFFQRKVPGEGSHAIKGNDTGDNWVERVISIV